MQLKPAAPVLAWQQQLQPDPLSIFNILDRTHTVFGNDSLFLQQFLYSIDIFCALALLFHRRDFCL